MNNTCFILGCKCNELNSLEVRWRLDPDGCAREGWKLIKDNGRWTAGIPTTRIIVGYVSVSVMECTKAHSLYISAVRSYEERTQYVLRE